MDYYNEIDTFAASWLANLMDAELIPRGHIDTRSITDVQPADLTGYERCHFFAGIAGWELALQLAGWPRGVPVWTGSCPCQPFSAAGKGLGEKDPRHLWPEFFRLIRECRPHVVFGEQVPGAIGHGWLDGVSADLEAEGYAVGSCVLGAHSVGAPHKRQRLYWVAESTDAEWRLGIEREQTIASRNGRNRLANNGDADGMAKPECNGRWIDEPRRETQGRVIDGRTSARDVGLAEISRPQGQRRQSCAAVGYECWRLAGLPSDPWNQSTAIECIDGKSRRISSQPGDEPLAYGIPAKLGPNFAGLDRVGQRAARTNRVGRLRAYGNAIVPEVAAVFIRAFMETTESD